MSDVDEKLSRILNTEYIPAETPPSQSPVVVHQRDDSDKTIDADYSRSNYYALIEQGNEAINGILNVARESQHPRAYEVAATLIKNMSEVTEKLMILQKQRKELESEQEKTQTNINVEQAVFVGSTADLLKKVRDESSKN
jgi:hypothetical protein